MIVRQTEVFERVAGSLAIASLVSSAGFEIVELEQRYLPGPKVSRPWTYAYSGSAVRR